MIELLGIGVADDAAGWLLRRLCARIGRGVLTLVVSARPEERRAFLDAVSGRRVPQEGRVWVNGIPVARDTIGRVRTRVAEVELSAPLLERRSLLWNALAVGPRGFRTVQGCLRLPRPEPRRAAQDALDLVGLGESAARPAAALDGRGRVGPTGGPSSGPPSGMRSGPRRGRHVAHRRRADRTRPAPHGGAAPIAGGIRQR
jgi:ABC-type uncharacterized transport system ATPase subunit